MELITLSKYTVCPSTIKLVEWEVREESNYLLKTLVGTRLWLTTKNIFLSADDPNYAEDIALLEDVVKH